MNELLLQPSLRYFLGPGLMALGAMLPHPLLALMSVGCGWLLVAASSWAADSRLKQQDARQAILMLLNHAVSCFEAANPLPAERTLRAALYLIDEASAVLRIGYATTGYSAQERELGWSEGQGYVGMAWEIGEPVVAPQDFELPVSAADAGLTTRPWNMTADQIRLTADSIASVIAVPILSATEAGKVRAVFVVDDTKGLDLSPLGNSDVQPAIEQLAGSLQELLEKAE